MKKAIFVIIIFALGWLSSSLLVSSAGLEMPFGLFGVKEVDSPFNHVKKDQIHVFQDRIVIDLENARWAEFTDTNSMDPVLDAEANSLEIVPSSVEDIHIGDIVVYDPDGYDGLIIHRVVDMDYDSEGWYATVKGDNLTRSDPEKVRFDQIEGVLVGIIY